LVFAGLADSPYNPHSFELSSTADLKQRMIAIWCESHKYLRVYPNYPI
jgi:hypothetical protein